MLATETKSEVVLTSLSGEELGRTGSAGSPPSPVFTAPVSFGGTVVATLALRPAPEGDIYRVTAALERAPEILAIALLNLRPPSPEERLRTRFFFLLEASVRPEPAAALAPGGPPQGTHDQLAGIADRLGLRTASSYLPLIARFEDEISLHPLQEALDRVSGSVLGQLMGKEYLAVLQFESWQDLEESRSVLDVELRDLSSTLPPVAVALGAGSQDRNGIARCLAATRKTLDLADPAAVGVVLDARESALARLVETLRDDAAVQEFIDEQIGTLLRRDVEVPGELFETLAVYAANWGSKTDAAKALRLQRQTLYQRLDKILAALGPLPAGSPRIPAVLTAVFLEQGRRRLQ